MIVPPIFILLLAHKASAVAEASLHEDLGGCEAKSFAIGHGFNGQCIMSRVSALNA